MVRVWPLDRRFTPMEIPDMRLPQVTSKSGHCSALIQSGLRPNVSCQPGMAARVGNIRKSGVGTARISWPSISSARNKARHWLTIPIVPSDITQQRPGQPSKLRSSASCFSNNRLISGFSGSLPATSGCRGGVLEEEVGWEEVRFPEAIFLKL